MTRKNFKKVQKTFKKVKKRFFKPVHRFAHTNVTFRLVTIPPEIPFRNSGNLVGALSRRGR